jgi:threonine dehydrogenase-like Zn-dependent dehydrogenase
MPRQELGENQTAVFDPASGAVAFEARQVQGVGAGELLVAVTVAGVCGTDAHRLAGDVPTQGRVAFGHEGVGRVVAAGNRFRVDSAGEPLAIGDYVYWFPGGGCLRCYNCVVQEDPGRCSAGHWPPPGGEPGPAAFQRLAHLGAGTPVFRLSDPAAADAIIALGCALPTALGGFRQLDLSVPPRSVVIQGAGPVGLASTLVAAARGAERIIVIGDPASRLSAARSLGATDVVQLTGSTLEERSEQVRALLGGQGPEILIEATGYLPAFEEGLALLGARTQYLILGLYSGGGTVPIDPVRINNLNARIIGSLGSSLRDQYETVRLASLPANRARLAALITHRFPLTNLDQAVAAQGNGAAIKAVVTPAS